MTVPLVGEFCASTSVYGRLAPLPPVAVADADAAAGTAADADADAGAAARVKTPPVVSSATLPATSTTRLSFRMEWNTFAPFEAECRHDHRRYRNQVGRRSTPRGVSGEQS